MFLIFFHIIIRNQYCRRGFFAIFVIELFIGESTCEPRIKKNKDKEKIQLTNSFFERYVFKQPIETMYN